MPCRSKTSNWKSTVAGTMSIHCPKIFKSGTQLFKESGWWTLTDVQPPVPISDDEKLGARYKSNKGASASLEQVNTKQDIVNEDNTAAIREVRHVGRVKRQRFPTKSCSNEAGKVRKTTDRTSIKDELTTQEKVKSEYVPLKIETAELFEEKKAIQEWRKSSHLVSKVDFALPPIEISGNGVSIKQEPLDCSDDPIFDHQADLNDATLGEFADMEACTFDEEAFIEDDNSPFTVSSLGDIIKADDTSLNSLFPLDIPSHYEEKPSNLNGDASSSLQVTPSITPCSSVGDSEQQTESFASVGGNTKMKSKSKKPQKPEHTLVPLGPKRELELLVEINKFPDLLETDPFLRRLRRKLLLRKTKRETGLPIFNLDLTVQKYLQKMVPEFKKSQLCVDEVVPDIDETVIPKVNSNHSYNHPALRDLNILDRFHLLNRRIDAKCNKSHISFISRLMGDDSEPPPITSPYTSRVLKPYIRRDFESVPKKLAIANELFSKLNVSSSLNRRQSIDYCYVQPNHIPALNAMCSNFFWPGIDLTECLQYPEFSCVVVYGKLLIGFAFMVPDVKFNEAYISFILVHPDWQRAGIGTFMMYHLVQTCMGKDITLHVSPSNPSMMLYQRLGFKAEQLILGFYDKYLPEGSRECKHAFLLRLQR